MVGVSKFQQLPLMFDWQAVAATSHERVGAMAGRSPQHAPALSLMPELESESSWKHVETTSEESYNWSGFICFHRIPHVAMQARHLERYSQQHETGCVQSDWPKLLEKLNSGRIGIPWNHIWKQALWRSWTSSGQKVMDSKNVSF